MVRLPQWRHGSDEGDHCVLTYLCTALGSRELAGLTEDLVGCPECPRAFDGEARLLCHLNDVHGWTWWDFAERPTVRR